MLKKLFCLLLFTLTCTQHSNAHITNKIICGGVLACIGTVGALICYNKKITQAKKMSALEDDVERYFEELRSLERSHEYYKNFMLVFGAIAAAGAGIGIWGIFEREHALDGPPLEQPIEVLPGEIVTFHGDRTCTVESETGTYTIPLERNPLLQRVSNAEKDWVCHMEILMQSKSERLERDNPVVNRWEAALFKEASRTFAKIKNGQPLNDRDKFLFTHFNTLGCMTSLFAQTIRPA